jgi:hypothetical protein
MARFENRTRLVQLGCQASFVLISSPQKDWANIFTSDNGDYPRYGYNLSKDRWAYEIEPPNSERIKKP